MYLGYKFCKRLAVSVMVGIVFCSLCNAEDGYTYKHKPSIPEAKDTLVGVNYFNGWWEKSPNKYEDPNGKDWRSKYPERIALLGQFNSQEVMNAEIKAASEYGVDFFAVLWYYNPQAVAVHRKYVNETLNDALDHFTNSPNSRLMQFSIEFCNHPPFHVKDFKTWNECIDIWLKYMKHPSYLRINGRPFFKVHGAGAFLKDTGGKENAKKWLEHFRKRVKDAGLGELIIGAGNAGIVWQGHWAQKIFDFNTEYMHVPKLQAKETDYHYNSLALGIIEQRGIHRFDQISFIPFMATGWNPRPWWKDKRPAFKEPTKDQWTRELKIMAYDLENLSNMGIKLNDSARQKIFTIYAWNEFGEGGIVAPTQGQKYMKLEGIKEVFGVKLRK